MNDIVSVLKKVQLAQHEHYSYPSPLYPAIPITRKIQPGDGEHYSIPGPQRPSIPIERKSHSDIIINNTYNIDKFNDMSDFKSMLDKHDKKLYKDLVSLA